MFTTSEDDRFWSMEMEIMLSGMIVFRFERYEFMNGSVIVVIEISNDVGSAQ